LAEGRTKQTPSQSRVAIVGADSLLARELRERLDESAAASRVELISAALENSSVLGAGEDDEPLVMSPLNAESLTGTKVAFLAGTPASSRRAYKANPPDGPVLIDLTGALEDLPEARLRAPSALTPLPIASRVHVIANPAAIALTTLLRGLSRHVAIANSVIHVFEPASERGRKGIDELQQQTVAVLSFKKLKTDTFDAQLGFNLLARYGEEAPEPLEEVEARIGRHLASLLAHTAESMPMPSLRLIQAPVFHGHSFSILIEFAGTETVSEALIAKWLDQAGVDVREEDPPTNAGIAGQSGLSAGAIHADANHPRAFWIWAVADNLRLSADNAVAVAREFL